jgi:NADPH:quinone reductase-like Zn-dependent oxidoreductase
MKAVVRERYGSPDVLELEEVEQPELTDDGVLVRVRAASVNPADWYGVTGRPLVGRPKQGFRKPKSPLLGVDFAGVVEALGKDFQGLVAGDEVFGGRSGALAEIVNVKNAVARKPANVTFEQAAAIPVAATTALQGLRDHGRLQPGQRVLINGASGGVGTFAVQIAKALGAEVTGVCSTRNVELVRSLGADHVVDYTCEDFTRGHPRYDLMLDVAGSRPLSQCRRALAPAATVVIVGGPKTSRVFGPLWHVARMRLAGLRSSQRVVFFIAKLTRADLEVLRELVEAGKVTPVVERTYPLEDAAEAFRHLGDGPVQGKLVVTV